MFEIAIAAALARAAGLPVPSALDLLEDAGTASRSKSGRGSKYHDGLTHGHCRLCEGSCVLVPGPNSWPWTDRHSGDDGCAAAEPRPCRPCGAQGWLICQGCGGTGVVACSGCGGAGVVTEVERGGDGEPIEVEVACPSCGGTGTEPCPPCSGQGRFPCEPCYASGYIPGPHWPWRYDEPA